MSLASIQSPTNKYKDVTVSQFTSTEFNATDAALAVKLQQEQDALLAQQLHDETLAQQYDQWKQAEDEWNKVEQQQHLATDAKIAAKLSSTDEILQRRRIERQQQIDSEFAQRLQNMPTPVKQK